MMNMADAGGLCDFCGSPEDKMTAAMTDVITNNLTNVKLSLEYMERGVKRDLQWT